MSENAETAASLRAELARIQANPYSLSAAALAKAVAAAERTLALLEGASYPPYGWCRKHSDYHHCSHSNVQHNDGT